MRMCCYVLISVLYFFFFFFNDTATTEIYTLSLHDALPISARARRRGPRASTDRTSQQVAFHPAEGDLHVELLRHLAEARAQDRKSTRLNSSHANISYAVFCLKKKN